MSDSFSLPLRPIIEKRDRPDTLPRDIAQINAQWGSFRDLNEAKLLEKIEEDQHKDPWEDEDDSDKASTDLDISERRDQLYKRRAEIIQFAMAAHMEASFALDFVSLLLSKHNPRQAETSMSPFLKQAAPLGSLNAEVVNPPPRSDSALKDIKSASRGWRIQNFNSAANKLLNAGSRLDTEVTSETTYWDEVLTVKEKGWKVCRLPQQGQALGVQYGFLEATPIFRDRGLAALRRNDDGSLFLDKGLIPERAQGVRVRVKHGDRIVGCSKVCRPPQDAQSIESRILQARDTVFEEELFHEVVREARTLGTQGVTTRQNLVQIPVSDGQEILLDLVNYDQDHDPEATVSNEQNVFADAIAHSIRILLTYAHRQNLRRRTQPPPPVAPKRRPVPEYHILRPIMAYLQHKSHIQWLESLMSDFSRVLESAGIRYDFKSTEFSSIGALQPTNLVAKVEALVRVFLFPFESTFSGTLITPQSSFRIHIRTNPAAPPFGTFYDISVNLPQYPDVKPPSRVGLQDDVSRILTHVLMLDLTTAISQSPKPSDQQGTAWEVDHPHHGELVTSGPNDQSRKMRVSLSREELTVHTYSVHLAGGFGQATVKSPTLSETWKPDTKATASLLEFVSKPPQPS